MSQQLITPDDPGYKAFELQLQPFDEYIGAVVEGTGLTIAKFKAMAVSAILRNPSIADCTLQSKVNAILTGANFALPIDGIHSAVVKFKDQAQWLGMYQGYVVLGGRGGFTLTASCVWEGDGFDFQEGTNGYIKHNRILGNEPKRAITAAWAKAESQNFPPLVRVFSRDQIIEVRNRSPQYRKKGDRSVWGTDFKEMARKTPIRHLAKDVPYIPLHAVAQIETYMDIDRSSFVDPRGVLNVAPGAEATPETVTVEPTLIPNELRIERSDGSRLVYPTIEQWQAGLLRTLGRLSGDDAAKFRELNGAVMSEMSTHFPDQVAKVEAEFDKKVGA